MFTEDNSRIGQIRHYCRYHPKTIFDVAQIWRSEFSFLDQSSFRKYVSRLVKDGFLSSISKGVYFVGDEPQSNIDEIILQHYCGGCPVFYAKESLLYREGVISEKPILTKVYLPWDLGNRTIRGFYFIQSDSVLDFQYMPERLTLLELMDSEKLVDEDDLGLFGKAVLYHCEKFKNERQIPHRKTTYPRITYIKLAKVLDKCHISNSVMNDYENGPKLLPDKELPRF